MVILERRNAAGKALFKPVTAWNGSKEDNQCLLEELERLQKDPSILVHDAVLPELNNEFASVRSLSKKMYNSLVYVEYQPSVLLLNVMISINRCS